MTFEVMCMNVCSLCSDRDCFYSYMYVYVVLRLN